MKSTHHAVLAAALLFAPLSVAQESAPAERSDAARSVPRGTLDTVITMGANISAGFGARIRLEGEAEVIREKSFTAAEVLNVVLGATTSKPVQDFGSFFMYKETEQEARKITTKAAEAKPTLVMAVDYPLWFTHGDIRSQTGRDADLLAARRSKLITGLGLLRERFDDDVLIVLGDIPDLTAAVGGRMGLLPPIGLPLRENVVRLNQDLVNWAEDRGNVVILPFARFMKTLHAKETLTVDQNEWPAGWPLIQVDQMHLTVDGLTALMELAMVEVTAVRDDVDIEDLLLDRWEVRFALETITWETDPVVPQVAPLPGVSGDKGVGAGG